MCEKRGCTYIHARTAFSIPAHRHNCTHKEKGEDVRASLSPPAKTHSLSPSGTSSAWLATGFTYILCVCPRFWGVVRRVYLYGLSLLD